MGRPLKLFINYFLSSLVFTYFIAILVLLLNPHVSVQLSTEEFLILFLNLYVFYGPLWFVLIFFIFVGVQFFSEKRYAIGVFKPHTITYFFSFTVLITAFVLYLNYDYYYGFLGGTAKSNFIRMLLINLALVITGIVFAFFKKINRKWLQVFFLSLLVVGIVHSYSSLIRPGESVSNEGLKTLTTTPRIYVEDFKPRKIRIVLMDGLSSKLIHSLAADGKLLNFKLLLDKGVSGGIKTFKPNLTLSMMNTALTGLKPSQFARHSHDKFKFAKLKYKFDIRPRYIFFRKSSSINTTAFFKEKESPFMDSLKDHYEDNDRKCVTIVNPSHVERYSEMALQRNNRFRLLFPDLLRKSSRNDENYKTLKKYFFLDNNLKNRIPSLRDSDTFYSIVSLPGLGIINHYFYQYHEPHIFGAEAEDDYESRRYGWIIEKYYQYYDSIIGNLMTTTGENELLVILSYFEYEPLPVWRRILVNLFGQKDVYVYKAPESQGTILLYEKNALKNGYSLQTVSIYDIFPTLLYYAGFQLSKDLGGEVLRQIFIEDFLLNNPINISTRERPFGQ